MVVVFEKDKSIIYVTKVANWLKRIWTTIKPKFFQMTHQYIGKRRSKRGAHAHALNLLIIFTIEYKEGIEDGNFKHRSEQSFGEAMEVGYRRVSENLMKYNFDGFHEWNIGE